MTRLQREQQATRTRLGLCAVVAALMLVLSGPAFSETPFNKDKPFAEHFLVLQISDSDPAKQAAVLSVAANLIEYYGPDMVDIEVVAFGPGIGLVFADNDNIELVDSLADQGVRFDGCMNTIDSIVRKTGEEPDLNPNMIPVRAGVARILELTENGYTLVRP